MDLALIGIVAGSAGGVVVACFSLGRRIGKFSSDQENSSRIVGDLANECENLAVKVNDTGNKVEVLEATFKTFQIGYERVSTNRNNIKSDVASIDKRVAVLESKENEK